ncbi:MAG: DUF554 domain-containing protein [Anaerolineae bacterium]|uniref:DUF554 domain-containing protein n=1 Tax=Candidatus Amarolinea dominans TaxID=3140696 RepID=UPI0031359331|nr:DUF554 domain-containing protein [Anaerolineae bacterium]MBK9230979.1 DUF554 domain-containing protein [Anaerolineae bacterium]
MIGTILNIVTVIIGGGLGSLLGDRLPDKTRETVLAGLGLMTSAVGMSMALQTKNVLIPMFSVLLGGVLGEWARLEDHLEAVGRWLERRVGQRMASGQRSVTRAFVTASLVFCIGPMTILGSIQDGLTGDFQLLAVKSLLDGFASLAFAATLGPGVILSALTILVVQGSITGLTVALGSTLGEVTRQTPWVIEMTATGGVLVLGISLLLLDLRRVRVGNLMPAVLLAPLIVVALQALHINY